MGSVRKRNLQVLQEAGFVVAESLPEARVEHERRLRPIDEILGRLLAIKAVWLWVDTHPDGESDATLHAMIEGHNLRAHVTPNEAQILALSREDAMEQHGHLMGWKNENCWALAWILGYERAPAIDVGQVTGPLGRDLMLDWTPNNASESTRLRSECSLRPIEEVHALEDLFYCAHNAVRSAQLGGTTVPNDFDPVVDGGCIHERRHALTWALSPGVPWDNTDLST